MVRGNWGGSSCPSPSRASGVLPREYQARGGYSRRQDVVSAVGSGMQRLRERAGPRPGWQTGCTDLAEVSTRSFLSHGLTPLALGPGKGRPSSGKYHSAVLLQSHPHHGASGRGFP